MATRTATKSKAKSTSKTKSDKWASRAAMRLVDAGNSAYCAQCGEQVKFRAKIRARQAICNVYVKGNWDRVEHYHEECYIESGEPYGTAEEK